MSDYTQTTFFAPKDLLTTGNPDKIIYGAELDPELSAISTAIATKYDSADLASSAQAQAETNNTTLMTPLRVANWGDANAGIVGDLQAASSPGADRIIFWDNSAGAATFLTVSTGLTLSGTTLSADSSTIDHDALTNFVADEHVAHSSITFSGTEGVTGGGTLAANRTFQLDLAGLTLMPNSIDTASDMLVLYDASVGTHYKAAVNTITSSDTGFVTTGRTLTAGNGLSGGGDLSANRTFDLDLNELGTETGIAAGDFIAMVDITDSGSQKITFANFEAALNHDSLTGFVANEHIDHSSVSISAGTGLSGGGTIAANRSLSLSHLGIESLTDPNDDRILFWDDSASATAWLDLGDGLTISGTTLSADANVSDTKYKTASTSRSSTTTVSNDPHLAGWTIEAGAEYIVEGWLLVAEFGGDFDGLFQFDNAPQDASFTANIGETVSGPADVTWNQEFTIGGTYGSLVAGYLKGHATLSATMDFQWAQNVSNASGTELQQGSWLRVTKVS